eukprot:COSAG02_NODE_2470_length_8748_cov_14.026477_4_plen_81_part_00
MHCPSFIPKYVKPGGDDDIVEPPAPVGMAHSPSVTGSAKTGCRRGAGSERDELQLGTKLALAGGVWQRANALLNVVVACA